MADKFHKPFGKPAHIVSHMNETALRAAGASSFDAFIVLYDEFVNQSIAMKEPMLLAGSHDDRMLLGAMGIAGEGGEVLDQFKKCMFHDCVPPSQMSPERRKAIIKEMGDKFWYDSVLLQEMGLTWREVMQANMEKLISREKGTGE